MEIAAKLDVCAITVDLSLLCGYYVSLSQSISLKPTNRGAYFVALKLRQIRCCRPDQRFVAVGCFCGCLTTHGFTRFRDATK
jgi:hypothetical protein